MMSWNSSRDSLIGVGARNHPHLNNNNNNAPATGLLAHRRVMSFGNKTAAEDFNNNSSDLFSRRRRSISVAPSDESDLQVRLGRLSVGSAKPTKNVLDDLLSSNEGGKHDYDWLLTPPGTPLFPSSDGKDSQQTLVAPRSNSSVRSRSANKTSRLSVSQSESNHPSRPARSSSVTRGPSISTTQYTSYSNRNTNILNTSSASVSSYIRPSTPTNRSSSTARSSTPSTRTTPSRGSTPARTRPSPSATSVDRTRPSLNSRPSTPTSRPQTPGNLTSPATRPASRPSTPTRRSPTPSLAPSTASSPSTGRALSSSGRSAGPTSRPSSPSPRVRPPPQPITLPDFPHETPPNLRTTLPNRPLSAGRSRPGGSATLKGNVEPTNSGSITRRHSSPIVTRGRLAEPPARGRLHANGHVVETLESRRNSHVPESLTRKPVKSTNSENGTGFGRNISKKSLDMAIRHMDIRNGGIRPHSGSTLFPQSIRSGNPRSQPGRASSAPGSVDGSSSSTNENGYSLNLSEDKTPYSSKLSEVDMYESSRYDAMLLKEDLKNASWLHSGADDHTDQGPLFDHGFEPLPEPFGPL